MMNIKGLSIFLSMACALWVQPASAYLTGSVNILGEDFAKYQVDKGESLYGIAKAMDWDIDKICALNPGIESTIKEGSIIYYPVASTTSANGDETITYEVSRSETVYGIAKQFDLTPEDIYAVNPQSIYGIKAGEKLIIPIGRQMRDGVPVSHIVKSGETLYGLAQQYKTTVKDIMRSNPGVSENNFQAGSKITIVPGTRNQNLVKETATSHKLLSITNYKVKKNDTWAKIAASEKIDEEQLKLANQGIETLKKDVMLIVPHTTAVETEVYVPVVDPRENTPEGRDEIFDEVQEEIANEAANQLANQEVAEEVQLTPDQKIAVVLDNFQSNKDMEFTRGIIAGVNELKNSPLHISLKVIDGNDGETKILQDLDAFKPTLIILNSEKEIPAYITDYAKEIHCYVANMFNVKSDLYASNPFVIQMLTPSEYFNSEIAEEIHRRYENHKFIIAGEPVGTDVMLENLLKVFDPNKVVSVPVQNINNFATEHSTDYLIYGTVSKKADVLALTEKISELKDKSPASEIITIGKASWVTLVDALKDKFCEAEVIIPSRSYFDAELSASKEFIDNYKTLYNHTPMKSFPVYSVAGYDGVRFLLDALYHNMANPEAYSPGEEINALQNDFHLRRVSEDGGLYNPAVYLVKFNSFGNIDKIIVE